MQTSIGSIPFSERKKALIPKGRELCSRGTTQFQVCLAARPLFRYGAEMRDTLAR
jgi:hypothetical protein